MLLKMTPQTALPTARQMSDDLSRWLEEIGNIGPSHQFRDSINEIKAALSDGWVRVDTVGSPNLLTQWIESGVSGGQLNECIDGLLPFNQRKGGFRLRQVSLETPPAALVGSLHSPILVIDAPDEARIKKDELDSFLIDLPIAVFLGWEKEEASGVRGGAWIIETAKTDEEIENTVLGRLLNKTGELLLDTLVSYTAISSLDSLSSGLEIVLDQEVRGLKARKAIVLQEMARSQQRITPGSSLELVGELRQRIQRHFLDFERGVNDRLRGVFAPQVGTLSQEVEDHLTQIDELKKDKTGHKTVLAISEDDHTRFMQDIRAAVAKELSRDLTAMRDLFKLLCEELNVFLESKQLPQFISQLQFLTDDRVERILNTTFVIQRKYSGEMKSGGFFEHAMASRRYLTLLFMALSSFGLLSLFRSSPAVMLPVTFLILAIGSLIAFNSAKRERKEAIEKELEKAKELLRSEYKRIFLEIQRAWSELISQHLAEQQQQMIYRVESGIRDSQSRQISDSADEKQRIQRKLQSLETTEKRLLLAAKGRETVGKAISQVRGELKQLILSQARSIKEPA